MRITLGTNSGSLVGLRQLAATNDRLNRSMERLSSGQRINRASDDAAGLSIASSLRVNSRVYTQGLRNISDAQSALGIAEGSLGQLTNLVTRLRELSQQAANGTFSLTQRRSLDEEADQLVEEFNRLVSTTAFNGLNLLDGSLESLRIQAGYGLDGGVAFGLNQSLRRNVGLGSFESGLSTSLSVAGNNGVVSGDFTGDGIEDMAVRNNLGSITMMRGNGDGTFTEGATVVHSSGGSALYAADFNGDGKLDLLATASSLGVVDLMLGNGNGGFGTSAGVSLGSGAISQVAIGDVNGDGKLDLVATGASFQISVALGNGNGSFLSPITSGSGITGNSLALADFNNDGMLDLVASAGGGPSVQVFLGNNSGQFNSGQTFSVAGSAQITTGDFNGDGIKDIATRTTTAVHTLMGNGDGTFQQASSYSNSIFNMVQFQTADMNNDGVLDFVVRGTTNFGVLLGNADGTFQSLAHRALLGTSNGLALADFNRDGVLDFGTARTTSADVFLQSTDTATTLQNLNLNSVADAKETMTLLDSWLSRLGRELGNIGSFRSRLETAYNALASSRDNSISAEGRIVNADIAVESAEVVRQNILQQTAAAVLSQANKQPALAIRLLRT